MRISGRVLSNKRHISIALTDVYGIGKNIALVLCAKTGINPAAKVADLSEQDAIALQKAINDEYTVEGDLRREIAMAVKRLRDLKCYRGLRHRKNLPVRGQRTRTNAKTRKGKSPGKGSIGARKGGSKGSASGSK